MLPTRFFWRLYAGYILLILLSSLAAVLLVSRQVERESRGEIERTLLSENRLLAELAGELLAAGREKELQPRVRELGRSIGTRYTVIGTDGRVLADSEKDPDGMDSHGSRPEVLDARRDGIGKVVRYSQTLGVEMLYLAIPVADESGRIGAVRAAVPLDLIQRRMEHSRRLIFLGALVAALFALLIGLIVARRSTRPLRDMTSAARAMAEGRIHSQIPETRGSVEIRELAAAFNSMGAQLRDRMSAVESERNKLAAILTGMNEGVLAVDDQERILHVNQRAADILRLETDVDFGRPIWECSRVSEACELLSQCLAEGSLLRREITLLSGGRQRIIELKASPLPGEERRPGGAILVLDEVTEIRQLEAVRRDFIANASHELKTPLTVILGLAETLHDNGSLDEPTRARFTEKLHQHVTRLSTLVVDLLSLSRLESATATFEKEALDLGELAAECWKAQRAAAEAKGLAMEAELHPRPLPVRGDRSALRLAIDNLLDNAVKYTPVGGHIRILSTISEGQALIEVADTGIGIEPVHQARIFERFYRVDKARSRELGGTGLGLSIVKNVVLGHGGEVSVESAPGRGSRFRLRLPLASRD